MIFAMFIVRYSSLDETLLTGYFLLLELRLLPNNLDAFDKLVINFEKLTF